MKRLHRPFGLIAIALIGLVVTAGSAAAHAVLTDAEPSDGAVLDTAPETVTLRFSESVDLPAGGLRVFDDDANRIDEGQIDTGGAETIGVALPADLPDGGYVVTWRVISTDSHPITGVQTFTVGDGAAAVDDAVISDLFADRGPIVGVLGPALRGAGYAGVLLAAGAVFLSALILPRDDDRRQAGRWAVRGAAVGIAATVLAVPVQVAAVTGAGFLGVFRPAVLGEVLASSFGQGTAVRLVWLVVLAVFVVRRAPWLPTTVAAAASAASFLLDGHQRSVDPTWLLMGADAVHLVAGALWFGGLVVVGSLVRSRSVDDDPVGAARLIARFSSVALVVFIAVSGAGLAMAWVLVGAPRALITTSYGWTLLAKVVLVLLVGLIAIYNRRRLVPAIVARSVPAGGSTEAGLHPDADGPTGAGRITEDVATEHGAITPDAGDATVRRSRAAWRQLRTTLLAEASLLLAVMAVTGALVTIQPAAQAAGVTGAFQTVTALTDDLDVELIVDPNEAGLNALHVFVLDETGRPADDVDDLTLDLTYVPEDIGPLRIEPFFAGTGHWTANTEELAFPGEWRIEVIAGIDRFTEERTEITVFVNR